MEEFQMINLDDFEPAFASHFEGIKALVESHRQKHFPSLAPIKFSFDRGTRYIRIVRVDSCSRSVHSFVDRLNGDVLKAAGWKAPAKHARGNIFDEANGLGAMGAYGPAYLR
jgi:hypothetical protein